MGAGIDRKCLRRKNALNAKCVKEIFVVKGYRRTDATRPAASGTAPSLQVSGAGESKRPV